ncbi:MAG: hypothetical protein ACLTWR_02890 [Agathobaculum desmolans]
MKLVYHIGADRGAPEEKKIGFSQKKADRPRRNGRHSLSKQSSHGSAHSIENGSELPFS